MQCCMPSYVCGCPDVGEYTIWFSLRGGGVYAFISANILYTNEDLEDAAFECMWLWLWPFRLPKLTVIWPNLLCSRQTVRFPSTMPEQKGLVAYIIDKLDIVIGEVCTLRMWSTACDWGWIRMNSKLSKISKLSRFIRTGLMKQGEFQHRYS
jgi:hypothetical protein